MTWADRLGLLRYFQNMGQSYAEMFRGSLTASGVVTAAAAWLGMSKIGAILLGLTSILFWQALAMIFGWIVWRWRVVHATLDCDWRNSPWQSRMLQATEETRDLLATLTNGGKR